MGAATGRAGGYFIARADAPAQTARLGEMLVADGLITRRQLRRALALQRRLGDRLGTILVHGGALSEEQVLSTLAGQLGLAYVDPGGLQPDPAALAQVPEGLMRRHHLIPLSIVDGTLQLAMADPLDWEAYEAVSAHTDLALRPVIAPTRAIEKLLQRAHAAEYSERATSRLLNRSPDESAHYVLSRGQRAVLLTMALGGLALLAVAPIRTIAIFNVVSTVFYSIAAIYWFGLIYRSLGAGRELPVRPHELWGLRECDLPVITVLVPLYREAAVVPQLVSSLAALDYPETKLDIKLLLEEDDPETIAAVRALDLPARFRVVVVPDCEPKTKPKACNYGLIQAHGRYVVIFDAEDRPEPDQLKKVVVAFEKAGDDVICIQCKLNMHNREQNLLTRWFTTEYSMWFDLFLPGLDAADVPIPLGGTSNYFVTDRLFEVGAWDPFNVTEDADLGIRLHRRGYKTAIVDSTTFEEANSRLGNWVRQRSRWMKGYMQTWLVNMRHPLRLLRELGPRRWCSFQLTVGGAFATALINPLYWAMTLLWALAGAGVVRPLFPDLAFYAGTAGLYLGNFAFAYVTAAGAARRGYHGLVKYALLSPLYWALMSVAAWKGLIQLFTRPFYWEKTVHGLDGDGQPVDGR